MQNWYYIKDDRLKMSRVHPRLSDIDTWAAGINLSTLHPYLSSILKQITAKTTTTEIENLYVYGNKNGKRINDEWFNAVDLGTEPTLFEATYIDGLQSTVLAIEYAKEHEVPIVW